MKKLTSLLIALSLILGFSCSENSDERDDLPMGENYLEITINGEKFIQDTGGGYNLYGGKETCDNKPGEITSIGNIRTSEFEFSISLHYYGNLSVFETSKVGTYNVCESDSSTCNLDAVVYLVGKPETYGITRLEPDATNKVTQIKQLEDNSKYGYSGHGGVKYEIKGEISMAFTNNSNEDIIVTGKYKAYIYLQ